MSEVSTMATASRATDLPSNRALLLMNRHSRQGAARYDEAVGLLEQRFELVHGDCSGPDRLCPVIEERAGELDLVVVGGGDGTMNAAAPALIRTGLPLGILPLGTANDLARTLGIPPDLEAAAGIIADGFKRTIDLGDVNGHPFFNVASIGLSAELAQSLSRDEKRRFGKLGYAFAAIRVLVGARPFRATIAGGGRAKRVRTLQIAIGNGRYYGGGNAVERTAAIDDGHLDLYSLEFKRAWKLAFMARAFRYGEHGAWREVRAIRDTTFEVHTRRPRPVNADGEIVTSTPARFTVLRDAVTVFAPKEHAEP
jgi:diacylglycerol kinase (ATP)